MATTFLWELTAPVRPRGPRPLHTPVGRAWGRPSSSPPRSQGSCPCALFLAGEDEEGRGCACWRASRRTRPAPGRTGAAAHHGLFHVFAEMPPVPLSIAPPQLFGSGGMPVLLSRPKLWPFRFLDGIVNVN